MAESKKEPEKSKKKSTRKVKATTGAWWKSKVVTEEEESAAVVPSKPDEEKVGEDQKKSAPKSGERKSRGKSSARSSGRQKPKTGSQKGGKSAPAGNEQQDGAADKPVSQESGQDTPAESVQEETKAAPAGQADPESLAKEKPKGRSGRGRRGRKKPSRQGGSDAKGEPAATDQGQTKDKGKAEEGQPQKGPQKAKKQQQPKNDSSGGKKDDTPEKHQPVVKLLINAEEPEECRLALLEDGRLESLHVTTVSRVHTRNNIYKARVVAIEPNLQAAFVDYGVDKNGFLTFSEIHPEYYRQDLSPEVQNLVDTHQWKKLSILDVIEKGQEMLVQVVKEEVGKKGANMTTYLSLPGRNVVLMPGSDSEGISRKISGEEKRNQLRETMNSLSIPEGIGWIVRTASVDITKTALSKDVRFLLKLWREIKAKGQHLEGVGLLYQDHNCVMRFLREHFDPATQEILVDDETSLEKVKEFTMMLPAKQQKVKVKLHRGARPIFNQYSVEDQIESIYQPRVNLPSGGSIVIEPTEALVSIDVNSGSTAKGKNFEETIFQANMEAATELARQLRLRDLGGLIVVDFIDMRSSKHVREVEKQVKTAMKRDKAKADISRISRFGLLQISRQKLGSPIESGNYRICPHCRGRGTVKSVETLALFYLRRIQTGASRKQVVKIDCKFPLDVAQYLLNNKRNEVIELEEKYRTKILIQADPDMRPIEHEISFQKLEKEEGTKKQG